MSAGTFSSTCTCTCTGRELCDLELLLCGAFAPLTTYLGQADYEAVVSSCRLADGRVWPMPIVHRVSDEEAAALRAALLDTAGDAVIIELKDPTGLPLARLHVAEVYEADVEAECANVYGTTDTNHPYVKELLPPVRTTSPGGSSRSSPPTTSTSPSCGARRRRCARSRPRTGGRRSWGSRRATPCTAATRS